MRRQTVWFLLPLAASPRMRTLSFASFLAIASFGLLGTKPVLAEITSPVRVEMNAPAGCPTADDFVRELARRAPVRAATADEPAQTLRVVIEKRDSYVAQLETGATAGVSPHQVEAGTCEAVVKALAITAALSLDERAWRLEAKPAESDAQPQASAQTSPPEPPVSPPGPSASSSPKEAAGSERMWLGSLGVGTTGVSLPWLAGPKLGVETRATERSWAIRAQVGYLFALTEEWQHVDLGLPLVSADLCPIGVKLGEVANVFPCATAELGAALGEGVDLRNARSTVLGFGTAGIAGRADFKLGGGLRLDLAGGASFVWWRPRFTVGEAGVAVAEADRISLSAAISVGYAFP